MNNLQCVSRGLSCNQRLNDKITFLQEIRVEINLLTAKGENLLPQEKNRLFRAKMEFVCGMTSLIRGCKEIGSSITKVIPLDLFFKMLKELRNLTPTQLLFYFPPKNKTHDSFVESIKIFQNMDINKPLSRRIVKALQKYDNDDLKAIYTEAKEYFDIKRTDCQNYSADDIMAVINMTCDLPPEGYDVCEASIRYYHQRVISTPTQFSIVNKKENKKSIAV